MLVQSYVATRILVFRIFAGSPAVRSRLSQLTFQKRMLLLIKENAFNSIFSRFVFAIVAENAAQIFFKAW